MNRRDVAMRQVRQFVTAALALFAFLFIVAKCTGCTSEQAKAKAADEAYALEHMRCVAQHETNAEIDDCRARVRERWGITTTVRKDAGR